MEDIFEELAAVSDDEGRAEDDQEGSGNRDDEAVEANDTRRVVQPKRVIVRQPRPKLDPTRLLGPRGIFTIQSTFSNIKFKGKGHELDDLNNVLSRLQHWAHRLFPKMTFEDCIDRIEELGNKKPIQTNMHKIRNGMVDLDDGHPSQDNEVADDGRIPTPPPEYNAFDQLIAAQAAPQTSLTDEQRARMMRNRLLAEERRMARRLAREKELEEQRLASIGATEERGNTSSNAPSIAALDGNIPAETTLNPTHDIHKSSSSNASKSTDASIRSINDVPSGVFDVPVPSDMDLHKVPGGSVPPLTMEQSAAVGGEETARVLCSDSYAANTSVTLSNGQKGPQDPKMDAQDAASVQSTADVLNPADSATGGKQNQSQNSIESVVESVSPITDSPSLFAAAATGESRIIYTNSPSKVISHHQEDEDLIFEGCLEVFESDSMDVEHAPKPKLDNSAPGDLPTAEEHTVQSSSNMNETRAGKTPKPVPAAEALMDVGSAEDWEEAFTEEERALASQKQP